MAEGTPKPPWNRVFDLFHEALEHPPAEREAWLTEAAAGDRDLRDEVLSLLAAHEDEAGVLDEPERLDPLLELEDDRVIGEKIGPYRIVRRLGEGGMGVVFAAEQEEPIRRPVALKLIKLGMDTREVLARFATERQALALMDHPNIATVHDAGATTSGRPYFVMELVDGAPITRYADERRLTTRERLQLFLPVCRAVQHAHQKGIIHRDLKPSNVLVTEHDGLPVPKVIDFGVAKATTEEGAGETTLTRAGRILGTPEYMSPEQSAMGGIVDTRSDIYSVGVVLYELLSGVLPFAAERLRRASDEETRRILREEEPRSPSTRLSGDSPDVTEIAARRRADPVSLRRQLRGELDWIVMKALEKEPSRRYATASELAADVERYLADLPVLAGPKSRVYQARKFVRRHRVAVGVVSVAFLGLAAVAVALGVLLRETEIARAKADTELQRAEQVSSFLVDLFSLQDPAVTHGETVTARQLLDQRAEKVLQELGSQPDLQAGLLDTLSHAYRNLGLHEPGLKLLARSLESRRKRLGEDHLQTAASMHMLGAALIEVNRNKEAEPLLERALEIRREKLGPSDPLTVSATVRMTALLRQTGRFVEAERLIRGALEAIEGKDLSNIGSIVLQARTELATTLLRQGKFEEADRAFREALEGLGSKEGANDRADIVNSYGAMLLERGDLERAEPLLRESLASRRRMMGERHPRSLATLLNLALLLHRKGSLDEAERLYRETLDRQREVYGPREKRIASVLHNMALLARDRGKSAEAEPLVREALSIQVEAQGEEHPDAAYHLTLLGEILGDLGQAKTAEREIRRGLALRRAKLAPEHPEIASSLSALGGVLVLEGRAAEAEPVLREALALRKKVLTAGDTRTAVTGSVLGGCLTKLGRYDEAEPLLVEADAVLKKGLPKQRQDSQLRLEALRAAKP